MAAGAWREGGSHHCATCGAGERFIRRCPKPVPDASDQAWLDGERAKGGRAPDPEHEEACPRLWAETGERAQWFADVGLFERGHLLTAGGIEDQPCRWLEAQEVIASARAAYLEESRKK